MTDNNLARPEFSDESALPTLGLTATPEVPMATDHAAPTIRLPLTIGVTGHRDVSQPDLAAGATAEFFHGLAQRHPHTPLRLLSGLAEGGDRIAAHAFLRAKADRLKSQDPMAEAWELLAVLPMDEDAYRKDFPETLAEFDTLLGAAASVIVLPSPRAHELVTNPELRDDCYEALGRHLVRHSNILLALWDGVQLQARGGTSNVVRMKLNGVERQGHAHRHVSGLHDCGPVWHIPVSRRHGNSLTEIIPSRWLYPTEASLTQQAIENSFRQIDLLNLSLSNEVPTTAALAAARWLSPSPQESHSLLSALGMHDRRCVLLQGSVDVLAMSRDRQRRRLTIAVYGCALGVAFSLWAALDGILQIVMAAGYLLCFGAAAMIFQRLKAPRLAEAPLQYRFLAEALRVQLYWSLAQAADASRHAALHQHSETNEVPRVLDGLMSQQVQEIGWIREALRACALDPAGCEGVPKPLCVSHVHFWVADQFLYFQKTEARYAQRGRSLNMCSIIFVVLGLASAALVLSLDLTNIFLPALRHIFSIAAAFLPAAAVLVQSYGERLAIAEQAKSALRMQWVFERARLFLSRRTDKDELPLPMVRSLGEEALTECANWLVLRMSKPPSIPT